MSAVGHCQRDYENFSLLDADRIIVLATKPVRSQRAPWSCGPYLGFITSLYFFDAAATVKVRALAIKSVKWIDRVNSSKTQYLMD